MRTIVSLLAVVALAACAHDQMEQPSPVAVGQPNQPPSSPVTTLPAAPAAVPATPDAPFRAEKPAALASTPPFNAPVPAEQTLPDGAKLLVVENHALPLVALDVTFRGGIAVEPLKLRGLSGFVAQMLTEGTKKRSAIELTMARERLGAELSSASGPEGMTVHLNALKETLPDALALLSEVILHPAFEKADVERVRGLLLTRLEQKKGSPGALAQDDLSLLLWGPKSPWGMPNGGTPETVKAISIDELRRYHQKWFVPNNAVISVAGDVTPAEVAGLLGQAFAGWKPHALPRWPKESYPPLAGRQVVLTDVPTASQSQVWIGWRAPPASAPEAVPLLVANNVLGGLFTSRLNLNLREDKAFSYGVRSRLESFKDVGTWVASGGIVAAHTAEAVVEYERELWRLRSGDMTDEELARAKEALVRGLPSLLETNDAVAGAMARLVNLGLPLDYYKTFPDQVRSVTRGQVVAAVQNLMRPDSWPVVVVGPERLVDADTLKQLGPVTKVPLAPPATVSSSVPPPTPPDPRRASSR